MTEIEDIIAERPGLKKVSSFSGINLLDLPKKEQREIIFWILNIELEAREFESDLYCPNCSINLPKRAPFFDWDSYRGEPSYYCTFCDSYFNDLKKGFIKPHEYLIKH